LKVESKEVIILENEICKIIKSPKAASIMSNGYVNNNTLRHLLNMIA